MAAILAVLAVAGTLLFLRSPAPVAGGVLETPAPASPSRPQAADPSPKRASTVADAGPPGPLVALAHAGGGERFAEETLPALLDAARSGAAVDLDVRWTADGVAILANHPVMPTAKEAFIRDALICEGRARTVESTAWAVLRKECHSWAPASRDKKEYPLTTYDEAMGALAAVPGAQALVEIKDPDQTPAQDEEFLDTIAKHGMQQRVVLTSYDRGRLVRIGRLAEARGLTLRRLLNVNSKRLPDPRRLKSDGLWGVMVRSDLVTKGYFSAVRAQGLLPIAQERVRDEGQAEQLERAERTWAAMKAAGAALTVTDHPHAYQRWLG